MINVEIILFYSHNLNFCFSNFIYHETANEVHVCTYIFILHLTMTILL